VSRKWIVALFVVSLLCGLQWARTFEGQAATVATPDERARQLVAYVTITSNYAEWKTWPGSEKLSLGTTPHGLVVTIYLNDTAYRSLSEAKGMAAGSMIVVADYGGPTAFELMYKLPGYNPEGGDWYWLSSEDGSTVSVFGRVDSCLGCHKAAKDRDYLR